MRLSQNPLVQSALTTITILILSLAAAAPIIWSLPCSDDVAFHLLRLTELDFILQSGTFYSRWAPNMAQGYGFPLFNFYAPLSYYAAELLSLLFGNLNLTLRWTFFLGIFLSGVTMYRFSRDHFSQPASFVAAVAYMYAPYQGYDVYFRGNLAESFAWWLLPLALWCIGRLAITSAPKYFIATTLTTAAILLTHNAFALVFCPIIGLYGLYEYLRAHQEKFTLPSILKNLFSFSFLLLPFALALALALTTFFWLPALIERNIVHSDRLLIPPIFVYWGNFVTLSELFAPPRWVYTDLLNPSPPRAFGLAQIVLAIPAVFTLFRSKRQDPTTPSNQPLSALRPPPSPFFLTLFLLYTFLMLEPSRLVWEIVPLLEFVQFPWRLLGCTAVALAFLTAAGFDTLTAKHSPFTIHHSPFTISKLPILPTAIIAIVLLTLSNQFWFTPRYCQGLENPTIADMLAFERDTQTIGTTAKGEYIPLTADVVPPYTENFFEPNDAITIQQNNRLPKELTAQLSTTEPTTLIANIFYYPGWIATVNGRPTELTPRPSDGLIALELPSGTHNITITFGETPLRRTANWISIISLLLLPLALFAPLPKQTQQPTISAFRLPPSAFIIISLLISLFSLLLQPLHRTYLPQEPVATYQSGIMLLDYTLSARTAPANKPILVTTRLKTEQQLTQNIVTLIELVDADGRVWSSKESPTPRIHRGFYDSTTWPLHEYAEDMRQAAVLPATPPGTYTAKLVLFDRATLARLPLADGRTEFDLGTIELTRPTTTPEIEPRFTTNTTLAEISLIGFDLDRLEANSGDPFSINFYWQTDSTPSQDQNLLLQLVAPDNSAPFTQILPPIRQSFPMTSWQAGDLWRGQHTFRLPASLDSSTYLWQLCLTIDGVTCNSTTIPLDQITITAPDRTFIAPEVDITSNEALSDLATLHGATLSALRLQPSALLDVSLIWQPLSETAVSHRVFVQLLDPNGRPIAISDGEPASWSRPTTSWAPDEFVTDTHTLILPETLEPGDYTLITGIYDPATSGRLQTNDGRDTITITTFTVE